MTHRQRRLQAHLEAILGPITNAQDELALDSFALVDFLEGIEVELGIVITPQDLLPEHFTSLATIWSLFEGR